MISDIWSLVADRFQGNSCHSLDNDLIAVPAILELINRNFPSKRLRILDYGCGTGGFCRTLYQLGHNVVGVDSSEKMIEIALQGDNHSINFIHGTVEDLNHAMQFDLITSVMVFQFINDLDTIVRRLGMLQSRNGILIFAVHSAKYVHTCLTRGNVRFTSFEDGIPGIGEINLTHTEVPIYIRLTDQYHQIIEGTEMYERLDSPIYPPFSQGFLKLFPNTEITDVSKYEILCYCRK